MSTCNMYDDCDDTDDGDADGDGDSYTMHREHNGHASPGLSA